MARNRTTKKLAQRIDLNYFKRPTPLKRAKLWLGVALPAIAVVWVGWHGAARDSSVYSSGRMSEAHTVLEKDCAACHVQTAGSFSAKASDGACLSCHDGPVHHAMRSDGMGAPGAPRCADCHQEHRGRVNLRATSDQSCAHCHSDLKSVQPATNFTSRINSFEDGHPEFAAVREHSKSTDPGTIRVNHAMHMKPIRSGPNGPNVQLECGDCHRPAAASTSGEWAYADTRYTGASSSYSGQEEIVLPSQGTLQGPKPITGRELMARVRFAYACSGCHSLAFDTRFSEGVPHDKPEVVHTFLVKKFSEYIATHPAELRELPAAERGFAGGSPGVAARIYSPNEWIAARINDAEKLLWRKTCKQCHALAAIPRRDGLPTIEQARTIARWMPHATFDHDAHRGFSCVSCHEKAMSSTEMSDLLLPGIATCKACHAPGPGHAESQCSECHTYHDWAKRKEVRPTFTLPALRTGGR